MSWLERFLYKKEETNDTYQNGILYSEKESVFEMFSGKPQKKIVRIIFRDKKTKRRNKRR